MEVLIPDVFFDDGHQHVRNYQDARVDPSFTAALYFTGLAVQVLLSPFEEQLGTASACKKTSLPARHPEFKMVGQKGQPSAQPGSTAICTKMSSECTLVYLPVGAMCSSSLASGS
jgi:hypothetical protein